MSSLDMLEELLMKPLGVESLGGKGAASTVSIDRFCLTSCNERSEEH